MNKQFFNDIFNSVYVTPADKLILLTLAANTEAPESNAVKLTKETILEMAPSCCMESEDFVCQLEDLEDEGALILETQTNKENGYMEGIVYLR